MVNLYEPIIGIWWSSVVITLCWLFDTGEISSDLLARFVNDADDGIFTTPPCIVDGVV